MNTLERLQEWYVSQCNGDWEHSYGISVETLDNPGWLVKVNLKDTRLLNREFSPLIEGIAVNGHPELSQWISCKINNGIWEGAGDESQLERILRTFLEWTENHA